MPLSSYCSYDSAPTHIYPLSLHDALPIFSFLPMTFARRRIVSPILIGPLNFHRSPKNASVAYAWVEVRDRSRSDRKSTRLNSSHPSNSYAVFGLKQQPARTSP